MKSCFKLACFFFMVVAISCANRNDKTGAIDNGLNNRNNQNIEIELLSIEDTDKKNAYDSKVPAEVLIPFIFNGRHGYLNSDLQVVIEPQFTRADHFSEEGFAIVGLGNRSLVF